MRKRKKRGGTEWVQSWEREKGRENRNQKHCMRGKKSIFKWKVILKLL